MYTLPLCLHLVLILAIDASPTTLKLPKTAEERQVALAAALQKDPGVKHGSRRAIIVSTSYVYCGHQLNMSDVSHRSSGVLLYVYTCDTIAVWVSVGSGDSGFDGTVMSGINALSQYQHYFGLSGAGVGTSIVFGIYTLWAQRFIFCLGLMRLSVVLSRKHFKIGNSYSSDIWQSGTVPACKFQQRILNYSHMFQSFSSWFAWTKSKHVVW